MRNKLRNKRQNSLKINIFQVIFINLLLNQFRNPKYYVGAAMICRRFKQIFSINLTQYHCEITPRHNYHSRSYWIRNVITFIGDTEYSMQSVLKFKNLVRLWGSWTRTCIVNSVVRRCSRDKVVKDMVQRFRHTILRPRNTLLISATAAYRSSDDNDNDDDKCDKNITDEELKVLF